MRHRSGSNENQKTSLTGANTRRWEGMGRKSECGALVLKFQAHPIPLHYVSVHSFFALC